MIAILMIKAICFALLLTTAGKTTMTTNETNGEDHVPATQPTTTSSRPATSVRITVVYDNNPYKKELSTGWGFACLVEGTEKTILFDTGGNGQLLLKNMKDLKIDPEEIDVVILSHIHGDHVGGLAAFLEKNSDVAAYLPESFPKRFKEGVSKAGARVVEVKDSLKICKDVYSTGQLGKLIKEQSLVLRTPRGMVVITGCAHPGIVEIVDNVKSTIDDDVLLVMGGFHLFWHSKHHINAVISQLQKLDVRYVGPCHCSGDTARELFKETYQDRYLDLGVGRVIRVSDLP